jgi:hypothetical protein
MDHGTQYTADDFLNQVRFSGYCPSFAFVAEPQTNGVAERFNRTLTEPAWSRLQQCRGSAISSHRVQGSLQWPPAS